VSSRMNKENLLNRKLKSVWEQLGRPDSSGLVLLGEEESAQFPFEPPAGPGTGLVFVAAGPRAETAARTNLPGAAIFRRDDPACIDNLKIRSDGRGYAVIIVWDSDPAAVRLALGAAAVLGEVFLYFSPRGKVSVDLHSTINYKSLRIRMGVLE